MCQGGGAGRSYASADLKTRYRQGSAAALAHVSRGRASPPRSSKALHKHCPDRRIHRQANTRNLQCANRKRRWEPFCASPASNSGCPSVFAEHRHGITLSVVQFSSKVPTSQAMSPDPATTIFAETKVRWKPGLDISERHAWRIAIVPMASESAGADDCRGQTDVCCSHQPRYWRQRRDAGLARLRR